MESKNKKQNNNTRKLYLVLDTSHIDYITECEVSNPIPKLKNKNRKKKY